MSDEAIHAGGASGATGQVTVSDPGSELLATGQFSIGLSGQGSLLVENQGTVTTGDNAVDATEGSDISQNAGASGTAAVTGTLSLLTNTGRFVVGDAGLGSLAVDAGGTVTTSANATIASAAGSSVNVTGGNSRSPARWRSPRRRWRRRSLGTDRGPVAVESLQVGDAVRLAGGGAQAAVWIGSRTIDCARHPRPETVWPVCVARGAFGENVLGRDLYLSPDHAVFVEGVLIPVKLLINGGSIIQVKRNHVRYFHVELPEHAVILAEGLTVESYLDTDDRANFVDGETMRLFPDFEARLHLNTTLLWETKGAAPLVMTGSRIDNVRRTVMDIALRQPRSVQLKVAD